MNPSTEAPGFETDFETLALEKASEHVTIVRLNRPDASNALNTQMGRDLVSYFEDVALDPKDLRCVVLTGTGDKAFCAGGDLKQRRGMTDEEWTRQHVIFERMVRALIDCPVPIVGAVNGAAYGGGCEIAAVLRLSLRRRDRAFRPDRGHARDHAGRRWHPDPAARRRRAPGQGVDPHRPALHGSAGARLGSRRTKSLPPSDLLRRNHGGRFADRRATRRSRSVRPSCRSTAVCNCRCATGSRSRSRPTTGWSRRRTAAKACSPSTRNAHPISGGGEPRRSRTVQSNRLQSNRLGV